MDEPSLTKIKLSSEELACENTSQNTLRHRDENGRFVVAIPFKLGPCQLGNSKTRAQYKDQIDTFYSEEGSIYYKPRHAVISHSSLTTKFRVVFDASAKSDTNEPLNDLQLVGFN